MIQRVLAHYHLPFLSCVGLMLFLLVFTGSVIWVFRRGSKEIYAQAQNIPLQDLRPQQNGEIHYVN
jgi:cbb3-type cytochrome oxidase subunit 3